MRNQFPVTVEYARVGPTTPGRVTTRRHIRRFVSDEYLVWLFHVITVFQRVLGIFESASGITLVVSGTNG
jgi:hypothetical protein